MKKFLLKLSLFIIPVLIYLSLSIYIDAYNVFHVENLRLTYMTPNQNFIKTKYILNHPNDFNAFIFGSSRAGNLPKEGLPTTDENGDPLYWYNMTYAMGCPEENYQTIKTFLDNGVAIKKIVILIDEISMWKNAEPNTDNLIFKPYQTYQHNPLKFYYAYIKQKPLLKLLPSIIDFEIKTKANDSETLYGQHLFYSYGVEKKNTDMSISSGASMPASERSLPYSDASSAVESLHLLKELCTANNIELIVITSPILQSTYMEGVSNGYLDFLTDVATVTDYYCFSGLNAYTTNADYYFDASHFRPYVGLEMEKVIFGNDDVKKETSLKAKCDTSKTEFGTLITSDNVKDVIQNLQEELY